MNSRLQKTGASRLAGLLLLLVMITPMHAAFAKVNAGADGVAVHGFDVVAYFLEGRAVRGTSEFEHSWQDVKWQFSSAANKDLFAANPERYAPQYGGFCAVCLALDGELTDANPKAWTIVDGKLYLNYSMHQRTQWRIRSSVYVKFGDDEWTKLAAFGKKQSTAQELVQIAILPPHGKEMGGEEIRLGILPNVLHGTINESDAFALKHSSFSADTSRKITIPEGLWPGDPRSDFERTIPPAELVNRLGKQLGVGGVLLYSYKVSAPLTEVSATQDQFYWKGFFFDIDLNRVYQRQGDQSTLESSTEELLSDFIEGRRGKSYRIAVIEPYSPSKDTRMTLLGGDVYKSIRQRSAFSITHADEPNDPSARSSVNRGGDWPFLPANVDPKEAWQGDIYYKTPNVDWLYGVGKELGVDILMTWYYNKANQFIGEWPVEVYVIDIKQQRVYVQKGTNNETSRLVAQALSDFVTGREP